LTIKQRTFKSWSQSIMKKKNKSLHTTSYYEYISKDGESGGFWKFKRMYLIKDQSNRGILITMVSSQPCDSMGDWGDYHRNLEVFCVLRPYHMLTSWKSEASSWSARMEDNQENGKSGKGFHPYC
jgi:hypothetical protein